MIQQHTHNELLRPYMMLGIETCPGIYFFVTDVPTGDGDSIPEVDYIGQANNVYQRVQFGSHHRLTGEYPPSRYFYLPLYGADKLDLDAAESLFIHLYRPRLNQSHMPRMGIGDFGVWVTRLIGRMSRNQHEALYRFLARPPLEFAENNRWMVDEFARTVGSRLSEEDQMRIIREAIAAH